MWPKYLPLAMFAYNAFNMPNLGSHSPYELIFGRNQELCLIYIQLLTSWSQADLENIMNY